FVREFKNAARSSGRYLTAAPILRNFGPQPKNRYRRMVETESPVIRTTSNSPMSAWPPHSAVELPTPDSRCVELPASAAVSLFTSLFFVITTSWDDISYPAL